MRSEARREEGDKGERGRGEGDAGALLLRQDEEGTPSLHIHHIITPYHSYHSCYASFIS